MRTPAAPHVAPSTADEDEWLWGWDPTPGIVSVWAEPDGSATIWRREPETNQLRQEFAQFRPWLLLDQLDDLAHLGQRLVRASDIQQPLPTHITYRELDGPGALRFLVSAAHANTLSNAVLLGASRRCGHRVTHLRELGPAAVLVVPPEEQYISTPNSRSRPAPTCAAPAR